MGVFMIFGALAIFTFPPDVVVKNPTMRIPIVAVMILYGGFRLYRAIKIIREGE